MARRSRMISIDSKLGAIKGNARELLDEQRILELCRAHGYRPEADGKLDPATVIALFMQQIAGGNLSCDEVRLIDKARFSASGYCQARMRLPQGVIEAMARETYQKFTGAMDGDAKHCWRGHRVLLIDSTSFSMPDTAELQAQFGQPGQQKSGCGFPVAHVLMLIYNMVRAVMVQAAQRQEAAVSRISFAGALHWMRHARPGDDLLPLAIVPDRPNRLEPRAVKRRPKQYDRLSRPRHQMREEARARMGVSAGEST